MFDNARVYILLNCPINFFHRWKNCSIIVIRILDFYIFYIDGVSNCATQNLYRLSDNLPKIYGRPMSNLSLATKIILKF